jgi:hypothetical protein
VIACKCPKCAKLFSAPEARRGDVISCPNCGRQLRLPGPATNASPGPAPGPAAAPRAAQPAAAPRPRKPTNVPDLDVGRPQPVSAAEDRGSPVFKLKDDPEPAPADEPEAVPTADVADGEDEAPRPRGPRRRRKKKRRKVGQMSRYALGLTVHLAGVGIAAFVSLVLAGLSFLVPTAILFMIGYGAILIVVGVGWLNLMAHEDGWEMLSRPEFSAGPRVALGLFYGLWLQIALLLILVTAVLYFFTNLESAWKPALVSILGVLTVAGGLYLLFTVGAM